MKISLLKKEQLTSHTYALYFDRRDYPYNFLPGQYVTLTLPMQATDGNGSSRDFTIASSPTQEDALLIVTKEGTTQAKRALIAMEPGEKLEVSKPAGGFSLSEENSQPVIFLAGGVGITPFHSMIDFIIAKKLAFPVLLFASFTSKKTMIFYDKLMALSAENPQIQVVYTLSEPHADWQGEEGRISEEIIKKYVSSFTKPLFFIAGSPKMTEGMEIILEKIGVPGNHIRLESFPAIDIPLLEE